MSKDTGIPLVATNDCHYIEKEDTKMHHILVCIQTNRTVEDEDTLEFGSDEFYFKSEDETCIVPGLSRQRTTRRKSPTAAMWNLSSQNEAAAL